MTGSDDGGALRMKNTPCQQLRLLPNLPPPPLPPVIMGIPDDNVPWRGQRAVADYADRHAAGVPYRAGGDVALDPTAPARDATTHHLARHTRARHARIDTVCGDNTCRNQQRSMHHCILVAGVHSTFVWVRRHHGDDGCDAARVPDLNNATNRQRCLLVGDSAQRSPVSHILYRTCKLTPIAYTLPCNTPPNHLLPARIPVYYRLARARL